jgi:hypothetical protein
MLPVSIDGEAGRGFRRGSDPAKVAAIQMVKPCTVRALDAASTGEPEGRRIRQEWRQRRRHKVSFHPSNAIERSGLGWGQEALVQTG